MEPPLKRQRMSATQDKPHHVIPPQTTRHDLQQKLKSRFEEIFAKYERDFAGIGDEIDLATGTVVVDNGHLMAMRDEEDVFNDAVVPGLWDATSSEDEDELSGPHGQKRQQTRRLLELPNSSAIDPFDDASDGSDSLPGAQADWSLKAAAMHKLEKLAHTRTNGETRGQVYLPEEDSDPRWTAPEIPGLQPLHAPSAPVQVQMPMAERDHERSPSPEESLWAPDRIRGNHGQIPWTTSQDRLLHHLKTTTDISLKELGTVFPGKCMSSIGTRWRAMRKKLGIAPGKKAARLGVPTDRARGKPTGRNEPYSGSEPITIDRLSRSPPADIVSDRPETSRSLNNLHLHPERHEQLKARDIVASVQIRSPVPDPIHGTEAQFMYHDNVTRDKPHNSPRRHVSDIEMRDGTAGAEAMRFDLEVIESLRPTKYVLHSHGPTIPDCSAIADIGVDSGLTNLGSSVRHSIARQQPLFVQLLQNLKSKSGPVPSQTTFQHSDSPAAELEADRGSANSEPLQSQERRNPWSTSMPSRKTNSRGTVFQAASTPLDEEGSLARTPPSALSFKRPRGRPPKSQTPSSAPPITGPQGRPRSSETPLSAPPTRMPMGRPRGSAYPSGQSTPRNRTTLQLKTPRSSQFVNISSSKLGKASPKPSGSRLSFLSVISGDSDDDIATSEVIIPSSSKRHASYVERRLDTGNLACGSAKFRCSRSFCVRCICEGDV